MNKSYDIIRKPKRGLIMEQKILDIFYKSIVYEAKEGRVDCFFYFNVYFSTYIKDCDKLITTNKKHGLFSPILIINDKKLFDKLLVEYVNLASIFYQNDDYIKELDEVESKDFYKYKMIMTLLWSNASIDDFNNPEEFLSKRIDFIKNSIMEGNVYLGYSEVLTSDILVEFKNERIFNETPNSLTFKCFLKNEEYTFPTIRFGIHNQTVYIYAMQKVGNEQFSKIINRKLYKIDEIKKHATNSKLFDTTSSFVVAGCLFVWLLENIGYKKFRVINELPVRWNSKIIKNSMKADLKDLTEEEKRMKNNATKKFINTFKRIKSYTKNAIVKNYYSIFCL